MLKKCSIKHNKNKFYLNLNLQASAKLVAYSAKADANIVSAQNLANCGWLETQRAFRQLAWQARDRRIINFHVVLSQRNKSGEMQPQHMV